MKPLAGPILTAAAMRAAEDVVIAAGTSVETLMNRAGAALASALFRFGSGQPVLVVCGPGNNGGDGYVAARLLRERGVDVRVAALRDPKAPAAVAARAAWGEPVEDFFAVAPAPILLDSLFGTGLARALEPTISQTLSRLTAAASLVIAADFPSGLGTDDGADLGGASVDVTIALGALKPVHLLQPGASRCGVIRVADIGVQADSLISVVERPRFTAPGPGAHKYSRGMAAIISGAMPGAARLSAGAAARLAGYVAMIGGGAPVDAAVPKTWDDLTGEKRLGALLIGPGLGHDEAGKAALHRALSLAVPLVLDADALTFLGDPTRVAAHNQPVILTPHAGEFDRLFGRSAGSKIDRASAAAKASGATIIFKGADSVVASPDGRVGVSPTASPWLASAGTGDVLAGIAVALLSSGMAAHDAACAAVWLHGEAARLAGPALVADDLQSQLPSALAACL
jgi:ADP-dependent NAD(P)H-hydrate dehydratase / NAD(P)H-hydrate epimerase